MHIGSSWAALDEVYLLVSCGFVVGGLCCVIKHDLLFTLDGVNFDMFYLGCFRCTEPRVAKFHVNERN